jgi:copper chaperone CopZ
MKGKKEHLALSASLVSALAASLCCIGPLVALLLGLGGFAAASVFAKWRPLLLGVTFVLLGISWFVTYRKSKEACAEGSVCAKRSAPLWNRIMLWVVTVVVGGTAAFPLYLGAVARWAQEQSRPAENRASGQPVALQVKIPSMDCRACAASIERMLRKQNGVQDARVSFDTKEAVVQYDPHTTTPQKIIEAIDGTGFKVQR